ncbi:uncharacterized protein LOC111005406 [Momordica charantia]|uniref:Uncharacterized protein LOC111005406 n=1 Tax=Momordica charantia TaxID=3673 RepID=A0A6J1BWN0_MOMCH|nr:uncharacterized protein LOC111005406 [Momordica charantia]
MLVRKKLEQRPDLCSRKFTTGDLVLANYFRRKDGLYACMQSDSSLPSKVAAEYDWDGRDKSIMGYTDGTHMDYPLRWMEVDVIYLPFNIRGKHWVMVCIDLEEGEIVVWDSLTLMTTNHAMEDHLKVNAHHHPSNALQM